MKFASLYIFYILLANLNKHLSMKAATAPV